MQDQPRPLELLRTVAEFLRSSVLPAASGHLAYELRVALNALELVARDLTLAGGSDAAEAHRLADIIGAHASLEELNRILCARLGDGTLTIATPGVLEHLWETTLAKLAVDQPRYAAYRREQENRVTPAT